MLLCVINKPKPDPTAAHTQQKTTGPTTLTSRLLAHSAFPPHLRIITLKYSSPLFADSVNPPLFLLCCPHDPQAHPPPSLFQVHWQSLNLQIPPWATLSFISPHYLTPSSHRIPLLFPPHLPPHICSMVYCRELKKQRRQTVFSSLLNTLFDVDAASDKRKHKKDQTALTEPHSAPLRCFFSLLPLLFSFNFFSSLKSLKWKSSLQLQSLLTVVARQPKIKMKDHTYWQKRQSERCLQPANHLWWAQRRPNSAVRTFNNTPKHLTDIMTLPVESDPTCHLNKVGDNSWKRHLLMEIMMN